MGVPITELNQRFDRQTGISLFAGFAIWFAHQNLYYGLTSVACKWGWFPFTVGSLAGLQVVQISITIIAVISMTIVIYLPWRSWRRYQTERPLHNPQLLHDTEKDRPPLVAFVVMGLNSFFLLFLLASFVPIFSFIACGHL